MNPNLGLWFLADYSGCGYLRSIFPNDVLNSRYGNRKLYEGAYSSRFILDKSLLKNVKFFHFQRQITKSQVGFIELIRKIRDDNPGIVNYKIVYDLDDLFTEIPSYNFFAKDFYEKIEVHENIMKIKELVDVFTVSTYPLKKELSKIGTDNCRFEIVPNFLPKYIYGGEPVKHKNEKPRIVWAGSSTHFGVKDMGDLGLIYDLIKNTLDEFEWIFLGVNRLPSWGSEIEDKIKKLPWCSSLDFPVKLKELNADFGMAPILENSFNLCKSNIKVLDYASADMVAICSKLKPYEEAKVFLKNDWKLDREQILDIFNDKEKKEKIISSQRRLLNKYWLETNLNVYLDLFDVKI